MEAYNLRLRTSRNSSWLALLQPDGHKFPPLNMHIRVSLGILLMSGLYHSGHASAQTTEGAATTPSIASLIDSPISTLNEDAEKQLFSSADEDVLGNAYASEINKGIEEGLVAHIWIAGAQNPNDGASWSATYTVSSRISYSNGLLRLNFGNSKVLLRPSAISRVFLRKE